MTLHTAVVASSTYGSSGETHSDPIVAALERHGALKGDHTFQNFVVLTVTARHRHGIVQLKRQRLGSDAAAHSEDGAGAGAGDGSTLAQCTSATLLFGRCSSKDVSSKLFIYYYVFN